MKILDANDDLSVQVHPDDKYAREKEDQPYGKTECWYVISAEEDAEIVLGHHASSKSEFEQMVRNGNWNQLLRSVKVKAGDFVYVPSGTIHAIGKGIVILETQQSSDITYRVYDYDRKDDKDNTRELHLESAIDVTTAPHQEPIVDQQIKQLGDITSKKLVQETYFTVYHWQLDGEVDTQVMSDFLQVSILEGNAIMTVNDNHYKINKGDHFILPATIKKYSLSGKAEFIVSHP